MTRHTRVDTTASAIITDADAFPPEATTPNKDDQRQGIYPLRVYEGYNYLPTAYGYKSYFGIQAELVADGLVEPLGDEPLVVEEVFTYQTRGFVNVLVALTSSGIFIREGGNWQLLVELDSPPANTSLPWTYVTIANILFMYRQGNSEVYVFEDIVDGVGVLMDSFNGMAVTPTRKDAATGQAVEIFGFVPTTINMAGQIGLFRAGGSLGFWDSDDSISWSAINDFTDFEPSLSTLANTTKLQDQIGAITTIKPHGDGFVVYCTRSVLYARENNRALLRYDTEVVLGNVGVAYPREVAVAEPDTSHYAFTNAGLMEVVNGQAKPIVPDFSDYVKATRLPQYMKMLNNRYLCVEMLDPNFIEGNVAYTTQTVDPEDYSYPGSEVGGFYIPPINIPGDKVCFQVPGDEDDETPVESGTKPYHLLQFYRQWLYRGATIQHQPFTINGEEIEYAVLIEGSDLAAYDVVPVKMNAANIPDFNATLQTDKLFKRQREVYTDMYDETILKLQEKWDAYQAAKGDSGKTYEVVGTGIVINSLPLDGAGGGYNPLEFYNYESGRYLQDIFGNIYVYSTDPESQAVDIDDFITQNPTYEGFVIDPQSQLPYYSPAYQWIGNVATTPVVWAGNGNPGSFNEASIADKTTLSRVAALDTTVDDDDRRLVINPESIQNIDPYAVEGSKLAYKLSAPNPRGVMVADGAALEPHRLVRSAASYVAGRWYNDGPFMAQDILFDREDEVALIYLTGVIQGESGGDFDIVYSETRQVTLNQDPGEESFTLSCDPTLDYVAARDEMASQDEAARNAGLLAVYGPKDSQYLAFKAAFEADLNALGPTEAAGYDSWAIGFSADSGLPSGNLFGPVPPEHTLTNYDYDLRRNIYSDHTAAHYPYIEVSAALVDEEEVSLQNELYGELPAVLPPSAVGVAAINDMDTETTQRGLIAVHQHYYSQNRRRDVLDPTFLIKAAGREDVPLGAPLGSIQEVIDAADFANRYFILEYNGTAPTDENGASFVVPGQDSAQALTSQQTLVCGVTDDINVDSLTREPIVYPPWTIEVPEITWILQNGSRAPFNPTMYGAYVYDLHLQKWGVFKGEYKHLFDYQPVNNFSPGSVSYKNFMIDGGCLTTDYEVALFNDYPSDNRLRYGKYQHVGSEYCAIEQVHAEFKEPSSGLISVQFSLDGRRLEYGHSVAKWYNEALSTTLNCDIVGQWATIAITGHFDLAGLRVKSNPSGRR